MIVSGAPWGNPSNSWVGASKEDRVKGKPARNVLLVGKSNCFTHSFCSEAGKSTGFFRALPLRVWDGLLDFPEEAALLLTAPAGSAMCVPCSFLFSGLAMTWVCEPRFLKGNSMTVGRSLWLTLVDAHWDWVLRRPRGARLKWWPATGSGCFLEVGP